MNDRYKLGDHLAHKEIISWCVSPKDYLSFLT